MEEKAKYLLLNWGHNDELLTEKVGQCASQFGDEIYREVLRCLVGQDFDVKQAQTYWKQALDHRFKVFTGANFNNLLRPALLHFMHEVVGEIGDPRILEAEQLEAIKKASLTDGLTGLYNQTYFKTYLEKVLANSQRGPEKNRFAVLLMDLDCFKQYNDRCGHLAGDKALRTVAEIIQDCIREGDVAARYGGEEFAILLPKVNRQEAYMVADRIRRAIEQASFTQQDLLDRKNLTISGGIAQFPEDGDKVTGLLNRADQQMYQAKEQRNAICPSLVNQRRSHRHSLQSVVELAPADANIFYTGMSFDISQGGISIGSGIDFQMGSTLQLRFRRPFWPVDSQIQGTVR